MAESSSPNNQIIVQLSDGQRIVALNNPTYPPQTYQPQVLQLQQTRTVPGPGQVMAPRIIQPQVIQQSAHSQPVQMNVAPAPTPTTTKTERKSPPRPKKRKGGRHIRKNCSKHSGLLSIVGVAVSVAVVSIVVLAIYIIVPAFSSEGKTGRSSKSAKKSKSKSNMSTETKELEEAEPFYAYDTYPVAALSVTQLDNAVTTTLEATAGVPQDGSWSPWSPCSTTCGPGVASRARLCQETTQSCQDGQEMEETPCYIDACVCSFYVSNWYEILLITETGAQEKTIHSPLALKPLDMAFDPLAEHLFWIDKFQRVVKDGKQIRILVEPPTAIGVDPLSQQIFVICRDFAIEQISYDGQEMRFAALPDGGDGLHAFGIAVLPTKQTLFWVDNLHKRVMACHYTEECRAEGGDGLKNLYYLGRELPHDTVSGLTIDLSSEMLYFIAFHGAAIFAMPTSGGIPRVLNVGVLTYFGKDIAFCQNQLFFVDNVTGGGNVFRLSAVKDKFFDGIEFFTTNFILNITSITLNN